MHCFRRYHPITKIAYFAVLFAIAMFSENPLIRVLSLAGALAALAAGGSSFKRLLKIAAGGVITVLVMGPVNCIIFHEGRTVLFRVFGAAVTAEAFLYGLSAGVMIVGTAVWCIFLTDETDSEDLVFTLGRVLPGVSAVITVTLRYIPEIIKKYRETLAAQRMVGIFDGKKFFVRAVVATKVFMSVTERSVENAMDTAFIMRARGYGLRRRVSASYKKWREEDTVMTLLTVTGAAAFAFGEISGLLGFTYYPAAEFGSVSLSAAALAMVCALFFALPALTALDGRIRWQKSFKSRT